MPIDANVYSNLQVQPDPGPVSTIGQITALKGQQLNQQQDALNIQLTQQKLQETQATRQALAEAGGDYDAAADRLVKMGYGDAASGLKETAARLRQNKWQERAADTQDYMRRGDLAARQLMGLESDPNAAATYANTVLPYIKQTAPEIAPQLPDHYDATTAPAIKSIAMQWPEARSFYQSRLENQRAMYGTNPKQGLAGMLSASTSDDEWTRILAEADPEMRTGFAPHFSPAAVQQAQRLSMSGYQWQRQGQLQARDQAYIAHQNALTENENWKSTHQGASAAAVYRQLNTAETWYENAMLKLEDEARGSNTAAPLTDDQYASKLKQIQDAYASLVRTAKQDFGSAAGAALDSDTGAPAPGGTPHVTPTSQQPPDAHNAPNIPLTFQQPKASYAGQDVALPVANANVRPLDVPRTGAAPVVNGKPLAVGSLVTMKDGTKRRITSLNPPKSEPVGP